MKNIDSKNFKKVLKIFREVFEDENLLISDNTVAADVEEWDSLNHITLIMEIESQFQIQFNTKEVMGWQNVGEMLASLSTKINARN